MIRNLKQTGFKYTPYEPIKLSGLVQHTVRFRNKTQLLNEGKAQIEFAVFFEGELFEGFGENKSQFVIGSVSTYVFEFESLLTIQEVYPILDHSVELLRGRLNEEEQSRDIQPTDLQCPPIEYWADRLQPIVDKLNKALQ